MKNLSGTQITSVNTHYEHVTVCFDDPSSEFGFTSYFISKEELVTILNEFDFTAQKKRTRTWLHLEGGIDDWRVEKFDEPRSY